MAPEPDADRAPRGLRLAHELALALVALSAALLAVLLLYVGPATTASFTRHGDDLLDRTMRAVRSLSAEQSSQAQDVLVDVIGHTAEARRRALTDVPATLYGDFGRLREALQSEDEARSRRLRANTAALARETQRRTERQIAWLLAELEREQSALVTRFAEELRTSHLLLCGALLCCTLGVLGIGLYHAVVRPVARLRAATRRVAGGDLSTPVATRHGGELGALATDFAAMVAQLQQSRQALDRLHANLESEVALKTRHLEQALADLHRSHRELAQAEKLASLGTLAGGVAHEFNNLIGGIRGCAAEARADEKDPERRETLEVILRAADRASSITSQLLRFARQGVERRERVDLGAVLRDAIQLVEPEARRRRVEIERRIGDGLTLHGDGDALHQVFVNLMTNALQAMPAGGHLRVDAGRDGGGIAIAVQDDGVGIAPEHLPRVFEPFFSNRDHERDPAQRGTGLGLSVSYGIVTAHGGSIAAESELGRGTTFRVRLPVEGLPVEGDGVASR